MASWEDELDVDLSHIWQADPKPIHPQPNNQVIADNPDDLAFPSQPPQPAAAAGAAGAPTQRIQSLRDDPQTTRVTRLSQVAVTRLQSANAADLEDVDIADAPTQVAEPFVSRSAGLTAPLPPLPSFQVVVSRESGDTVPLATQSLEGEQRLRNPAKGSGSGSGSGGDIRRYFTQGGGGGGSRRKTRIPGPVGDLLLQKEGGGDSEEERGGVDERVDECNDRVFRKGAWICALQSLGVAEFDPARYAILNVTASCIGSSRLNQRVPHFVAVIKELTPNVFGDAAVMLKDPTGTVAGMMNNQVFSNTDFARAISPGAVVILKQVAVFSPLVHYLNITIGNVVQVFPANTDLPQASAPKLEPLSQKRKLLQPDPKPLQEKPPPQLLEPTQGSSPQQAQPQPSPPPQEPTKASDVAAKAGSWDLLSPSPPREPSPPNEGGIAAAAKMAGWGDLTDDMEALLNEDVDDFYK